MSDNGVLVEELPAPFGGFYVFKKFFKGSFNKGEVTHTRSLEIHRLPGWFPSLVLLTYPVVRWDPDIVEIDLVIEVRAV